MRSEKADNTKVDCEDVVTKLACALDEPECPAACREGAKEDKDEAPKSGDLVVTAAAATNRSALKNGKISDLDTLTFKTSEEVTVSKVILERYGYSSVDDIAAVWLENEDGKIISNKAETATKGQYKLTIDKDYRKVDGTASATIVLQTKNPTPGSNIGFKVVDVTSTAANVNLDDYTPYSYDFVVYNGTSISFAVRGSDRTYNYEEGESYEVAKFRIKAAEDSATLVKGFTLTDLGNLDIEDETFEDVVVTVDDKEVKTSWSVDEDKETLTVAFNEVEIPAKEYDTFAVVVKLAKDFDQFSKKLTFKINGIEDVNAVEKKTGSRVSPDGALPTMKVYTFAGGKVRLTSEKLGSVDAGINATDVKVAEGKIELSQAIKSDATKKLSIQVVLVPGTKLNTYNAAHVGAEKYVKGIVDSLRIFIDGEEYTGTPDTTDAATLVYTFPSIEIEKSGKVQVLFDTLEDADYEGSTMTLSMSNLDKFYYSDGKAEDKVDVSGSLNFSKVTIQGASSSLTNNAKDKVEYKLNEVNKYTIFDGTFTAKKSDINLSLFRVNSATITEADDQTDPASLLNNKVTFYLSLDGKEVADAAFTANTTSDSFSDVLVKAGKSVSVKLEAEVDAKAQKELGEFVLVLEGEDLNGTPIKPVSRNTVQLKVVPVGTPSINGGASSKTVLRSAKNVVMAEFIVKPANGASELYLESLSFDISDPSLDSDDVTVTIDGTTQDALSAAYSYEPNLTIDADGAVVRVELNEEVYGEVVLDNININTKGFSNSYKVRYEEAVVSIVSMKDMGGTTEFTVDVDADSDLTVKNLVVTFENPQASDATLARIDDNVSDGNTFEAKGITNDVRLVDTITYQVYGSNTASSHAGYVPAAASASCAALPDAVAIKGAKFDAPTAAGDCSYTYPAANTTAYTAAILCDSTDVATTDTADPCYGGTADDTVKVAASCAALPDAVAIKGANFDAPTAAEHCSYTYPAAGTTAYTAAHDAYYTVEITKAQYPDFFKVGSDGYARTFQSNK